MVSDFLVKIEKHSGNMLKNKAPVKDSRFNFSKDVLYDFEKRMLQMIRSDHF